MTDGDQELLRHRTSGHLGGWTADGHLIITKGAVRFEFDGILNRLRSDLPPQLAATLPVVLYQARLFPPLFDAGLVLIGEEGSMTIPLFWGQLYRVRPALRGTNYPVRIERTWTSIGYAAGQMPLSPAPRAVDQA